MISHEQIQNAVAAVAPAFPIKSVSYFGSYAAGRQTAGSDLDLLVEFTTPAVSLIALSDLKNRLEDQLHIPVDVLHYPLPERSFLTIDKVVRVYEQ